MTIREGEQDNRPVARPAGAEAEKPRGLVGRITNLFQGVRTEITKVTWPSRSEARNLTLVVIGISVFVGGLLGIFDLLMVGAIRLLTGGGSGL